MFSVVFFYHYHCNDFCKRCYHDWSRKPYLFVWFLWSFFVVGVCVTSLITIRLLSVSSWYFSGPYYSFSACIFLNNMFLLFYFSGDFFEPYIPPEGDGKASSLTTEVISTIFIKAQSFLRVSPSLVVCLYMSLPQINKLKQQ